MLRKASVYAVIGLLPVSGLMADFSYEQTSTVTGGAAAAMMRMAGAFSRQANQPNKTMHLIKGDKMATVSANHANVIDLGAETITDVDLQKKTYSVMTFAQMKQMMEQIGQKMGGGEADFKMTANPTGATRKVNGLDAKQMIITIETGVSDPKSGQKGAMTITTDSWIASGIAGYDEVRAFQKKMSEKLNWMPSGGGMMGGRPDMARGMAQAAREMAKLDGVPVLQIVKMGGGGQSVGGAQLTPEQQVQMSQAQQQSEVARQEAAQQQAQPPQPPAQPEQPSVGSALGGALGGRLGHFGGLGRKKQQPAQEQAQPQPAPVAQQPTSAPPPGAAPVDPSVLLETTIELTNFSSAPVDGSKMEIPAGFKKVDPPSPVRGR